MPWMSVEGCALITALIQAHGGALTGALSGTPASIQRRCCADRAIEVEPLELSSPRRPASRKGSPSLAGSPGNQGPLGEGAGGTTSRRPGEAHRRVRATE